MARSGKPRSIARRSATQSEKSPANAGGISAQVLAISSIRVFPDRVIVGKYSRIRALASSFASGDLRGFRRDSSNPRSLGHAQAVCGSCLGCRDRRRFRIRARVDIYFGKYHGLVIGNNAAPATAPAALSAKAFDGKRKLSINLGGQCSAHTDDALTIAESKAASQLYHPLAGSHELRGFVLDDGTITMRLSGPAARGDFKGKIDDAKGAGEAIIIHSDGDCSGKWTIAKQ